MDITGIATLIVGAAATAVLVRGMRARTLAEDRAAIPALRDIPPALQSDTVRGFDGRAMPVVLSARCASCDEPFLTRDMVYLTLSHRYLCSVCAGPKDAA